MNLNFGDFIENFVVNCTMRNYNHCYTTCKYLKQEQQSPIFLIFSVPNSVPEMDFQPQLHFHLPVKENENPNINQFAEVHFLYLCICIEFCTYFCHPSLHQQI